MSRISFVLEIVTVAAGWDADAEGREGTINTSRYFDSFKEK